MNKILIKLSVSKTTYSWKLTVCIPVQTNNGGKKRSSSLVLKGFENWSKSFVKPERGGGTTELCYAAGKSQMAISDPYQSAKWLKVHLAKWRLASSIIHDALFSLLQGIHCSSLFYLQLVHKASLFFTLRIQIVSCNLFFVHESMKKNYLQNRDLYLNG